MIGERKIKTHPSISNHRHKLFVIAYRLFLVGFIQISNDHITHLVAYFNQNKDE